MVTATYATSTNYQNTVYRRNVETARSNFLELNSDKMNENKFSTTADSSKNSSSSDSFIGYSNLPNQIYRKAVRRGFVLNIMIVGQSGLGKSTFINSFLSGDFYGEVVTPISKRIGKTLNICSNTAILKENGINLKLTLIDTPGFGDCIDNSENWKKILDHIQKKFDDYMRDESRITRSHTEITDERIHACLYFIQPTGHSLRELDIVFLKKIQDKVNIILAIGKSDTLTKEESAQFKVNIQQSLRENGIKLYEFPLLDESLQGENEKKAFKTGMERNGPFSVIGSSSTITNSAGKKVLARSYPWGHVEIENPEFSDFVLLRELILGVHTQSLIDNTHNTHYSKYRSDRLKEIAKTTDLAMAESEDPMLTLDKERKEHMRKIKQMEDSLTAVFHQKVDDRYRIMDNKAQERHEELDRLEKEIQAETEELELKRREFEAERTLEERAWAEANIDVPIVPLTVGNFVPLHHHHTLGDRVLNEVRIKEKTKTEKKRLGIF